MGRDPAVWITVLSPIIELFPILIALISPLRTAPYQMVVSVPIRTSPITVAFGATKELK